MSKDSSVKLAKPLMIYLVNNRIFFKAWIILYNSISVKPSSLSKNLYSTLTGSNCLISANIISAGSSPQV